MALKSTAKIFPTKAVGEKSASVIIREFTFEPDTFATSLPSKFEYYCELCRPKYDVILFYEDETSRFFNYVLGGNGLTYEVSYEGQPIISSKL